MYPLLEIGATLVFSNASHENTAYVRICRCHYDCVYKQEINHQTFDRPNRKTFIGYANNCYKQNYMSRFF